MEGQNRKSKVRGEGVVRILCTCAIVWHATLDQAVLGAIGVVDREEFGFFHLTDQATTWYVLSQED